MVWGKFTDEIGNKLKYSRLTLTFNDKKDTVKTDINGQFTYKYTTTKYGTNTVTISHPGNDNYQKTSSQKTFTVNGPKNITVYTFYTDEYAVPVSEGDDEFYSYFEDRYESQSGPGVWVDIHNRYAQRLDDLAPTHRILSATFVFANDYTGQIKTKTVSPQYYDFASTSLIPA